MALIKLYFRPHPQGREHTPRPQILTRASEAPSAVARNAIPPSKPCHVPQTISLARDLSLSLLTCAPTNLYKFYRIGVFWMPGDFLIRPAALTVDRSDLAVRCERNHKYHPLRYQISNTHMFVPLEMELKLLLRLVGHSERINIAREV